MRRAIAAGLLLLGVRFTACAAPAPATTAPPSPVATSASVAGAPATEPAAEVPAPIRAALEAPDHSAKAGSGVSDVQTLHRLDEAFVRDEVQRAGFVFDGEAAFLRNPSDARDWNASPRTAGERRGTSDRFVLRFRKPK